MASIRHNIMESEALYSHPLDIGQFDTHGFCPNYPLRRHKFESLANDGCIEARHDWAQHIGPAVEFGGCNPLNGNFTAVVLPLCRPERLRLVAYVLECENTENAFLHDTVVEVAARTDEDDTFSLGNSENASMRVKTGRKKMQAKMLSELQSTDAPCAMRVMDVWKTMLATTWKDKAKIFNNLEDYLDFRIVDCGAPFVESAMVFGMGMTLTKDEDEQMAPILRPAFSALALANDYFSFDREWEAAQKPGAPKPLNAVWLYMNWKGVDAATAKQLVREASNRYERQFLNMCDDFRMVTDRVSQKLDRYLRAMSYQVSGNVVWSLNCPRYNPDFRYDPNAGIENLLTITPGHNSPRACPELCESINSAMASSRASSTHEASRSVSPASSVEDGPEIVPIKLSKMQDFNL
ncbi:Terpene cyclase ATR13 [Paramyrothecium foliicola]|nr:Terpene cyclase ATR13 [Paramyrothecium foliicola]